MSARCDAVLRKQNPDFKARLDRSYDLSRATLPSRNKALQVFLYVVDMVEFQDGCYDSGRLIVLDFAGEAL